MMARRTGAQQTGRKIAERSRGGKQKSPKPRKTPRSATPRPKRAAVSAADGPTGGPPVGPQLGDISSAWVVLDSWWNSALARRAYDRCGAGRGREGRTEGDAFCPPWRRAALPRARELRLGRRARQVRT